jgi:cobalt-zinc-cadmium efflux system membrane fusion protein
MKSKLLLIFSMLIAVTLMYRTYFQTQKEVKETTLGNTDPNVLNLDAEKSKTLQIEYITTEVSHFSPKVELLGETEALPDAIIDVPARVSGRLTSIHFIEGDQVKKGQILATIDSPELTKLRSNYMTTKTKYFAAEQNYERIKSLVQMNLAAKQELIDAESNLKVIRAERVSAEENLRVNGLAISDSVSGIYHVIAPRSGLAIMRNAVPGSQIPGNQTLTTIAELSELWFQGKIFEGDLHLLKEGDTAKVVLNAYPDFQFLGKLNHIGEKVDPISRTIHARILFKNLERKGKIGLFGKAFVEISPKEGIKIPSNAIQVLQERKYVFIQIAPNTYKWNEIKTGAVIDTETEILSGLVTSEKVVTNGSFELKAILFKSTFGEE